MRILIYSLLSFVLMVSVVSCKTSPAPPSGMETLSSWMTGSFSSEEQAIADTNFFDIRLEMVPVWKDRTDGIWLYVEQARADRTDAPYRQRVYRLTEPEKGTFESRVYEISNPLSFAGAWKTENPLSSLTPDSLHERPGCSLFLERLSEDTFSGSTVGSECLSVHRGATYAVSTAIITREKMVTWDQGFDSLGNQVWGSVHGGYIFKKIREE